MAGKRILRILKDLDGKCFIFVRPPEYYHLRDKILYWIKIIESSSRGYTVVSFINRNGLPQTVTYSRNEAVRNVKEGVWKILSENEIVLRKLQGYT